MWSNVYDDMATEWLDISLLRELETVPWHNVKTAIDLACGTGRIGQWLQEEKRIKVIDGVDVSPQMLALARKKTVYRNVITENITSTSLPASRYDLAVNVLAVCHLPRLDQFYAEVRRILKDGCCFLLVDYHPFFLINGIPTHFKLKDGSELAIENWVHFFSDHIAEGVKNTFQLLEMKERFVTPEWVDVAPNMEKHLHKPVSFVLVWKKQALKL